MGMKPFSFRLQTKLDLSIQEEGAAKAELQARYLERDRTQEELNQLLERLASIEKLTLQVMLEDYKVEKVQICRDYLPLLRTRKDEKEKELRQSEKRIEEARKALVAKSRENKTLGKLKEKEWVLYLRELQREEQKHIDEIAGIRHYRKLGNF